MQVSLFVPCLVEDFAPEIAEAAALALEAAGALPMAPWGQTCCGQPLYKQGRFEQVRPVARRFIRMFEDADAVVSPSGSCVRMVREYPALLAHDRKWAPRARALADKCFELCEFLVRVADRVDLGASFAGRVAYHESCQLGRGLGVRDEPRQLLAAVRGLALVELRRPQACCGFGGAFHVDFPQVADAILADKLDDIEAAGVATLVAAEPGCLLHIRRGLAGRESPVRTLHIAQILAGRAGGGAQ